MTDREKQIEAWILKAKDQILIDYDHYEPATLYLDHALNLLQEPCQTCGDKKRIGWDAFNPCTGKNDWKGTLPCPDCQSQEPAEKPEGVVFDNKSTIKTASS